MDSLTTLYYLKQRTNSKAEHPIYLRISVNGKRKETSIHKSTSKDKWDKSKQRAKGRTEDARILNKHLDTINAKINKEFNYMVYNEIDITADSLMNKFLGIEERKRTLITVVKLEISIIKSTVGDGTYRKYEAFMNHLSEFVKYQYNTEDINIKKVNTQFVSSFDYYLKTQKSIGNNTTIRYIKTFQKVIRPAQNNAWLKSDPFINYKVSFDKPKRVCLDDIELKTLINKDLHIDRLNRIRDLFVFVCYTGVSYSDLAVLSPNNILIDINGNKILKFNRSKTGTACSIPLLPIAESIIDKYKDDIPCNNKGILLPVISNERYNAYLKEIAVLCDIDKNISTHTARHTFASTVTLNKGIPIETVSSMLGHTKITTTQIYSKITDARISNDMAKLIKKKCDDDKSSENDSKEAI